MRWFLSLSEQQMAYCSTADLVGPAIQNNVYHRGGSERDHHVWVKSLSRSCYGTSVYLGASCMACNCCSMVWQGLFVMVSPCIELVPLCCACLFRFGSRDSK
jgi:hypothetical protein